MLAMDWVLLLLLLLLLLDSLYSFSDRNKTCVDEDSTWCNGLSSFLGNVPRGATDRPLQKSQGRRKGFKNLAENLRKKATPELHISLH